MPDKKLTDAEIVKGLECKPKAELIIMCNRLQAENEKLQKFKAYFDFYFGCDLEILGIDENGDTTSFDEFYNCAIANAESIEHHIAHIIKIAKAEEYKEFAKRLKDKFFSAVNFIDELREVIAVDDINNLLKELVGDNQ